MMSFAKKSFREEKFYLAHLSSNVEKEGKKNVLVEEHKQPVLQKRDMLMPRSSEDEDQMKKTVEIEYVSLVRNHRYRTSMFLVVMYIFILLRRKEPSRNLLV
jgi:hypothetical protein